MLQFHGSIMVQFHGSVIVQFQRTGLQRGWSLIIPLCCVYQYIFLLPVLTSLCVTDDGFRWLSLCCGRPRSAVPHPELSGEV